jgi:hypothetical protein
MLKSRAGVSPASAAGAGETPALLWEQVEDIGAYLRWIGVPTLIPVPVYLPAHRFKRLNPRSTCSRTHPADQERSQASTLRVPSQIPRLGCAGSPHPFW